MSLNKAEAAKHLLRLRDAEESFLGFVKLHYPDWEIPEFHHKMIDVLDHLERGTLDTHYGFSGHAKERKEIKKVPVRNILITMPPRHGKSTFGSVLFPAYFMARKPSRFMMSCSYNTQLSTDFGRQVRELANNQLTGQAFPDFEMSQDSRSVEVWRTTSGGSAYFVGLGGTTSGRAANMLVFDDPLKSREEAESVTQRNRAWNYYVSALSTRLQPDQDGNAPIQIIILTRWHPDDIAGRLMETDDWKEGRWMHINFPAVIEKETGIKQSIWNLPPEDPRYLPIEEGNKLNKSRRYVYQTQKEALWPERFNLEELSRRERLNPREFASLYMQSPFIQGGNLIRTNWWRNYPDDLKPENFPTLIISCDTAFKAKETSDYSVMMVLGLDTSGDIYIIDIQREKLEFPELKRRLILLNTKWRGKGLRGVYIEDKASGQSLIQELKRESGVSVIPYKVVGDKVARLNSVLPLIEGGRVYVPQDSEWLDDFMSECQSFPSGTHDDQVDALSMGLDVLSRTQTSGEYYSPPPLPESSGISNIASNIRSDLNKFKGLWKGWGE